MNHFIPLSEAAAMTARYRTNHEAILNSAYQNQNVLPICETFDREAFETLVNKDNCEHIRIYYGMNAQMQIHAIIVAADASGNDILPIATNEEDDDDIIDRGNRCPELCPPASALNS